uniref:Uncharacterized protein n=1 Tax=Cucumis melo TaxID=3656 RepID=A0A9I9CKF7_CUCME
MSDRDSPRILHGIGDAVRSKRSFLRHFWFIENDVRSNGRSGTISDLSGMASRVKGALDVFVLGQKFFYKIDVSVLRNTEPKQKRKRKRRSVWPMKRREEKLSAVVAVRLPSCLSRCLPPHIPI